VLQNGIFAYLITTKMKQIISAVLLTTLIFFNMNAQAQSLKVIEAGNLKLEVYNASENSFGVANFIR